MASNTKDEKNETDDPEYPPPPPDFDPFDLAIRDVPHPTTDCETLIHVLKAGLGTGVLAMPAAFMSSGLIVGIFGTIVVSVICTHCAYILVVCTHELYRRTGTTTMTFADVAEEACRRGPKWSRKIARVSSYIFPRLFTLLGIFITYFTLCSCYGVIVAKSFEQVATHYLGEEVNIRLAIAVLLVPLLLLAYIPNLKYLAPVSMIANLFYAAGLCITFYYLVTDMPSIDERRLVSPIYTFPVFWSITIFAIEIIGAVIPLANNMVTPQHYIGIFGVLNQGMIVLTIVYIFLGFLGYLKYGDETTGSITLNLPSEDYLAQAVKILIGLAVFCTFGLQFYVCIDIVWNGIKQKITKRPLLVNYILRTVLAILSVVIAIAIPTITPFVGLIGAVCFSILGIFVPVFIEVVTFWDKGFGAYNWKILKNIIVVAGGLIALIFGSKSAIEDIVALYTT